MGEQAANRDEQRESVTGEIERVEEYSINQYHYSD